MATSVACCLTVRAAAAESAPAPLGQQRYRTPIAGSDSYFQGFGSLGLGKGLRFNNPYRLATPLGDTAESLSVSATYYDIGLGVVRGPERGLAHGAVLHLSIAAQGVRQEVLSLSYAGLYRVADGRAWLMARAGVPVILEPDLSGGLEIGASAAYLVTAGLGVQGEAIGSFYYGAGTFDRSVTLIPVVSLQLGVFVAYEVLP